MTGNYGSMSQRPRSKTTIAPPKYFVGDVVTQNNEIEAITMYHDYLMEFESYLKKVR